LTTSNWPNMNPTMFTRCAVRNVALYQYRFIWIVSRHNLTLPIANCHNSQRIKTKKMHILDEFCHLLFQAGFSKT
ncbi:MAG: hypothetical protein KDI21_22630, partial [Halieaceae bacterium]|nr:hypothetical protein [Halieaceae bacterium]